MVVVQSSKIVIDDEGIAQVDYSVSVQVCPWIVAGHSNAAAAPCLNIIDV